MAHCSFPLQWNVECKGQFVLVMWQHETLGIKKQWHDFCLTHLRECVTYERKHHTGWCAVVKRKNHTWIVK